MSKKENQSIIDMLEDMSTMARAGFEFVSKKKVKLKKDITLDDFLDASFKGDKTMRATTGNVSAELFNTRKHYTVNVYQNHEGLKQYHFSVLIYSESDFNKIFTEV